MLHVNRVDGLTSLYLRIDKPDADREAHRVERDALSILVLIMAKQGRRDVRVPGPLMPGLRAPDEPTPMYAFVRILRRDATIA